MCSKDGQEFWVEVKSIDSPKGAQKSAINFDEFRSGVATIKSLGGGFVITTLKMTNRDIKCAVKLIDRVLSEVDLNRDDKARYFVIIPEDPVPNYNEFVRIEYQIINNTGEFVEVLYSVKSQSGKYSRCDLGCDLSLNAKVKVEQVGGGTYHESIVDALDLGLLDNSFRVSVQLMKGEGKFKIFGMMPYEVRRSMNVVTIRNKASDARTQIKSASDQMGEKPGVVIYYQENFACAEENEIISAFYGDLTCQFSIDEKKGSRLFYGCNGFFGECKNTSISAAIYFRNNEKPVLIYNHWAKLPLPQNLLDCKQYVLQDDGSFVIYE